MGKINGVAENILLNTQAVDYVVEQGTSGIWTYRKWNSGLAECWANSNFDFPAGVGSGITGILLAYVDVALPNIFTETPVAFGNSDWYFSEWLNTYAIDKSTVNIRIFGSSNSTSAASTKRVHLFVIGRWKEIGIDGEIE